MKFTILTLFPKIIKPFIQSSILAKAIEKKIIEVEIVNFRKFSKDKHKTVDGPQIGGGPGMVLMIEPIVKAIKKYKQPNSKIILLSPQGKVFNQKKAKEFANKDQHIILICGHYEGFDERIYNYIDEEISIGDYVLIGGEGPAAIILESVARLVPGVIKTDSLASESHNNYLLDYPCYSKPNDWNGYKVPEILLSGNHKLINDYRIKQQEIRTKKKRPDLFKKYIIFKAGDNNGKN